METFSSNILFIHPTIFFQEEYHKDLFYRDLPLKALELSALLKQKGNIETKFLDLRFEEELSEYFSKPEIDKPGFEKSLIRLLEQESVQDFKNIAFILTSSFQFLQTEMISDIITRNFPDINIIVAGHHPTAKPEDFLKKPQNYDVVIIGEPERALIKVFESSFLRKANLKKKHLILTSNHSFDINNSPFPDYETYLKRYNKRDLSFPIHASRGCPFDCRFCKIPKTTFRNFSFPNFIERFKKLQTLTLKYGGDLPKICFLDQSFNSALLSNKLLYYIIDNQLQEIFTFSCQTRIEIVAHHNHLLDLFKKAKIHVGYGFETANKGLLLEMNKTKNPTAYLEKMTDILNFYRGISEPYCRINILVGFPGENNISFQETLDFLEKHAFHPNVQINPTIYINDPITYAYKHTDYYRKKYVSEFIEEWWKKNFDPLKCAIPLKPSKNYPRHRLIRNYLNNYKEILMGFKFTSLPSMINWTKYFGHWVRDLREKI